jgi:hypothetical protein
MGALAGHMSHLYDNPRLTFTEMKRILQAAAEGELEGTEKTDGQNLFISFSVPKQELEFAESGPKAARNKTNIKSGGMSVKQLADKFSDKPALKKSFSEALRDFGDVIKSFPRDKQIEIFGPDTNIYYNAEIINPDTANVINYDSKLVSIHRGGHAEFDKDTGSPVEVSIEDPETGEVITGPKDVSNHAQALSDALDDIQQDISNDKFKVQMDAIFNLKGLEDKKALKDTLIRLEDELSNEGISDNQMIIEYVMARILSYLREANLDLDEETEQLLLKRILLSNEDFRSAYGYDKMPKELDPRKILKGASESSKNNAIYILKNYKEVLKAAIEPLEKIIHDFSVEMLRGLESLFILDNKKETQRLKDEVSKAISIIKSSNDEEALEILQKQMDKLKSVEKISTAAEGFAFDHDGYTYKFTGNFAPINQILGLFKYGRGSVPPLKNLKEEESDSLDKSEYVVLIPGGFKPLHKGHLAMINHYANLPNVHKVVVISGRSQRKGITKDMSEKLFNLYGGLSDKVDFKDEDKPFAAAFDMLTRMPFIDQYGNDKIYVLGSSDKGGDKKRPEMFKRWWDNNQDKNIYNLEIGLLDPAPTEEVGDLKLSGSIMANAFLEGDDETLKKHIPDENKLEAVKDILSPIRQNSLSEDIQNLILSLVEEVLEEKELDEISVSGNVAGYGAPLGFKPKKKKNERPKVKGIEVYYKK